MQIDVVYVVGTGSRWKNNELMYSLRSIEKHLSRFRNIWVVGTSPEWCKAFLIPAADRFDVPDKNILDKIKTACDCSEISDDFLFFNDDHYLLQDYQADQFPNYYSGTITEMSQKRPSDSYGHRCRNTMAILKNSNLPEKYFDVHYPILYNKAKFTETVLNKVDQNSRHGYIIKSLYANSLKLEGIEMEDCKSAFTPTKKLPCFSTQSRVSGAVYRFLDEQFPVKSRYEI